MASTSMDFDWCIAPVTRQAFFEQSYEKTHLVVRRSQRDYYSALLSIDDIDRAVTTLGLSSPEISVVKAQTTITEADFAYESGFVDSVRVMQLFANGATIILSNLQERLPVLATFCRALEEAFSSRIQTNIYLTPAHSQGFRAHYDNHDVIVQQVSGTKEWRIYDMPVVLPLTSQGFDPHDVPIGELTDSFVLEPGDMAYIPRGLTHDAVATDETSLHITTGLMTRPYADLIAEAVLEAAHSDPLFRHALPPGHARDGFDAAAMQAHFSMLMARLVERTSMEPLLAAARSQFIANRVPRAHGQMAQMAALDALHAGSLVSARPHLVFSMNERAQEDGTSMLQLSAQGADIMLPAHVRPTLSACLKAYRVAVRDLPGDLDEAGLLVLVRRLIREGLMVSEH